MQATWPYGARKPVAAGSGEPGRLFRDPHPVHIVPVVEPDDTSLTVLWMEQETVEAHRLNNAVPGGRDVLVWGDGLTLSEDQ